MGLWVLLKNIRVDLSIGRRPVDVYSLSPAVKTMLSRFLVGCIAKFFKLYKTKSLPVFNSLPFYGPASF
jgi:hypothetical protein